MIDWLNLHAHSFYSILDGVPSPQKLAKHYADLGMKAGAITDHGSISGAITFAKACKNNNIKPLLGCELYVCEVDSTIKEKESNLINHLCVLAKGNDGWKNLIKTVSASNHPDNYYYKPRLDLKKISALASGQFVVFSGHPGSELCNCIFVDKSAYGASTYEAAKRMVDPDWEKNIVEVVHKMYDLFGKENFFVEIQRIDIQNVPAADIAAKALRYVAKKHNFKTIGTADSHYLKREDAPDQRLLVCSALKKTLKEVNASMENDEFGLSSFFKSNNYYVPTIEEANKLYEQQELENCIVVSELCGTYNLFSEPQLPHFDCGNSTDNDYLVQICRNNWNKLKENKNNPIYEERFKMECDVIFRANLSSYFLIVQDYCNWYKSQGWLMGKGRGSAAGCLISYLLNITNIDPIKAGLMFERFYNDGRNQPGRISLPDIDCDFMITKRGNVIDYIKNKYGQEHVSQIITFGRMQGRSALKDVLRIHDACSAEEMNQITKFIPDESSISDELEEMREEEGESSIIKWALENNSKELMEWCHINDNNELEGNFSKYFAQAIRLEGTKRSAGKHAAGVVISPNILSELCPMIKEKKSNELICGFEMGDLESIGIVKFDILGVAAQDKVHRTLKLLKGEEIEDDDEEETDKTND